MTFFVTTKYNTTIQKALSPERRQPNRGKLSLNGKEQQNELETVYIADNFSDCKLFGDVIRK